jgi:hypothetical protein
LNGAVVMALGIAVVELDLGRGAGLARALGDAALGVLKSPLVLSAAGGLAVSALGLEVPAFLATFCDLLAAAVGPCALFAIGLFMVGRSPAAGALEVGWIVLMKLARISHTIGAAMDFRTFGRLFWARGGRLVLSW